MLIEFILGMLICIPLIPFNDLILKWAEKDPLKSIGIVSIMMAVNTIIILSYGFFMRPDKPKVFILGLLGAILILMLRKIKKLIK
ncbi:MAG: hypothetical protein CML63_05255 [Rhodobacteraceae bacterium]|nr:hypothetical protein [Paracoccaceae bacterium]|tara:strand:- start:58 stop:312 length:255 start_codon:yes stop_codon:yes gene_type:complete